MNATSTLILVMILSFAADRMTKAITFCLGFWPRFHRYFPDPRLQREREIQIRAKNRALMLYTGIIAVICGSAIGYYDDLRILNMLQGSSVDDSLDIVVTLIVVMGGSDLFGRLIQISNIGEATPVPTAPGSQRPSDRPIEISGRVVFEQDLVSSSR